MVKLPFFNNKQEVAEIKPKGRIAYEFETDDVSAYKLAFKCAVEGKSLNYIFSMAKGQLARKGVAVVGGPDDVTNIEVDERFYQFILVAVGGWVKDVERQLIAENKIIIISRSMKSARFTRAKTSDPWQIDLKIEGDYIQK